MKRLGVFWLLLLPLWVGATGSVIPNSSHDEYLRSNESKMVWFQGDWYSIVPLTGPVWTLMKYDGSSWSSIQGLEYSGTRVPDMLVDALNRKLYILFPLAGKLYRFSWSNNTWQLDSGFPVSISGLTDVSKNEPPCFAQARDGDLFISYMTDYEVRVFHSSDNGVSWNSSPYIIGTSSVVSSGLVDASSFYWNGKNYMGIFVAENSSQNYRFFRIADEDDPSQSSSWVEESLPGSYHSDNHVSMARDLDGNLFSVVKLGTGETATFVLYKRSSDTGTWSDYEIYSDGSNDTRPAVCVDEINNLVEIFATVDSKIERAVTSKENPSSISSGDWSVVIDNGSDEFNNVSVSYQQQNSSSEILVCGLNVTQDNIWYNVLNISYSWADDLIISEIHSKSNLDASYIELYNRGNSPIDLADYTLKYFNNNSSIATGSYSLSGTLLENDYWVLARDRSAFYNEYGFYPDAEDADFLFDGGRDGIGLYKDVSRAEVLVDQFNQVGGLLSEWNSNLLFYRDDTENDGTIVGQDYWAMGSNQDGTPGGENDQSLPVTLLTFQIALEGHAVRLEWETASEVENDRFLIYRKEMKEGASAQLIATVPGMGNNPFGQWYSYLDDRVSPGKEYVYWLASQDFDGTVHQYGVSREIRIPEITRFTLQPVYPNPFNSRARIQFQVPASGRVRVGIFDLSGRLVQNLMDTYLAAGNHAVVWNGENHQHRAVASGIYLVVVRYQNLTFTQKVVLVR